MFSDAQMSGSNLIVRGNPDSPYGVDILTPGFSNSFQAPANTPPNSNNTTGSSIPGTFQLTFDRLPNLMQAIGNTRQGTGTATIAVLGDSTATGYGAISSGGNGARPYSFPNVMAKELKALGVNASCNNFLSTQFIDQNATPVSVYDTAVSYGAGWSAPNPAAGAFGGAINSGNATTPLSYTPREPFDTIDAYYYTLPSGPGTASVNVSGGASLGTINFARAINVYRQTFRTNLLTGTVNIVPNGNGTCYVLGLDAYNSTLSPLRIYQCGMASLSAFNFTLEAYPSFNVPALMAVVQPVLTLVDVTINDGLNSTPIASYTASMQKIIDTAKLTGDCILCVGFPSDTNLISADKQLAISNAIYALATTNNIPVIDFGARWTAGYSGLSSKFYSSGLHPNAAGYADIANFIVRSLLSV